MSGAVSAVEVLYRKRNKERLDLKNNLTWLRIWRLLCLVASAVCAYLVLHLSDPDTWIIGAVGVGASTLLTGIAEFERSMAAKEAKLETLCEEYELSLS